MAPRKYFLDWLRVLAFLLLIVFHVGCLYAPWDYNLKSPHLEPGAAWGLSALGAWRMALLFLISGVACRFLMDKLGPGGFALDRVRRLLPTIVFAMAVVIPPQTYVELVAKGVTRMPYPDFWLTQYLAADQTLVAPLHKTMPTWDHLWFIVYLLVYTLLLAAFAALTGRRTPRPAPRWLLPVLLTAPACWLSLADLAILRATLTHALTDDWAGHFKWLGMFGFGVASAAHAPFWAFLRDRAVALFALAAVTLAARSFVQDPPAYAVLTGPYAWTTICALAGFAARCLDRPSRLLGQLNEAVLPVYVLHQPILLIAAYRIFPLGLPAPAEALTLFAITGLGSFALYATLIRPWPPMRFLFGMKA